MGRLWGQLGDQEVAWEGSFESYKGQRWGWGRGAAMGRLVCPRLGVCGAPHVPCGAVPAPGSPVPG